MESKWYYRIELRPGVYTNGRRIGTLSLLKELFARLGFSGQRVLDIGSQEFVGPILMAYHGASEVVAYDRLDLTSRLQALNETYDLSNVRYVSNIPMLELKRSLQSKGIDPVFDIVNFTGVLYHMVDPLVGLAIARSFLREGGLMVLETSTSTENTFSAQCNHEGALYPGSNYFQVSVPILDYWCRALRMEVVDAFWKGGAEIKRTFMVLRAKSEPVSDAKDQWMRRGFWQNDFEPYGLNYSELTSDREAPSYSRAAKDDRIIPMSDGESPYLDTYQLLSSNPDAVAEAEHGLRHRDDSEAQKERAGSLNLSDVGLG